MRQSGNRIRTTHVGSLIRPPELIPLLRLDRRGDALDEAVFAATLRQSVATVVRQQADAGIDIVSDGEFGKTVSWSRYVLERLGGIEHRPNAAPLISAIRGKDHRDFADFYAEYEGTHGAAGLGKSISFTGGWAITGPITYTGHAAIGRDIANLKAALGGVSVAGGFLPVVAPASVAAAAEGRVLPDGRGGALRDHRRLARGVSAIVDAGLTVQIDDAFLATTYDLMVPPGSSRTTADGRPSGSRRSTTPSAASRSSRADTTCAGGAGTVPTPTTSRPRTSSI